MEQTMEEFIELNVNILEKRGINAQARTTALKAHDENLLERYAVKMGMRLLDSNERSKGCKLVIPISYKRHLGTVCMLRNFGVRQEAVLNLTIVEAMLATLASPPQFASTSIFKDSSTFEYIGGDITLSNPTRQIVAEAYGTFGEEARIACLLDIGCGHPGIIRSPESFNYTAWTQFLEKLAADSEQKAEEIKSQMGHLGLYHRFSVTRGLEQEKYIPEPQSGDAITHTAVYLTGFEVSKQMDMCVDSLRLRDGVASLGQLQQSGGQSVLPAVLPPLTKHFVMRKKPWDFIEKAMPEPRDEADGDEPRTLVVTGMGGCGKTQLMVKFMHVHKDKFIATFFIDGSSVSRIRADTIRHVRSLSVAHSQKGFEDCLLFLSQPCAGRSRLILYDNVDDPDIDLAPLLPLGESCVIMITSRNRSLGELSPEAHLELDIMSPEEAVELLVQHSGTSAVITDHTREEAGAIARALGCLPIALTQARSYMYQTQCYPGEYLERLSSSRDKLLAQPVKHHRDMRYLSTYAAFDASFGLLTLRCQHLLRLLSCFHWTNFPLELVTLAAKHNFSDYQNTYIDHGNEYYTGRTMLETIFLHEGKWDVTELDAMMVALRNHSLITLIAGNGTKLVQMHTVAHGWVKSCIPEQETAVYQAAAVVLLSLGSRIEYTPSAQFLASHITQMSTIWDQLHINDAELFARILERGGSYEGALQLRERVVRELHSQVQPKIIDSKWSLASSYFYLGRYKDAEPLQREVLKLKTEVLGGSHPETISASYNLANTYRALGRLEEAEALLEEGLKLMKEILGEHHPNTFEACNSLALVYRGLGRLKEAEVLLDEILKLRKEILGERHPDTLKASVSLALVYYDSGRLKEAAVLQEEVLKLGKGVQGEGHPDIIINSNNLASYYLLFGRLEDAEALQVETLRQAQDMLGNEHPTTALAMLTMAEIYESTHKKSEALKLLDAAELIFSEASGRESARCLPICQQMRTRVQTLADEDIPVAAVNLLI